MIVVGSANSSNTLRLVDVALENGAKAAHRVDYASEVEQAWLDGVTTVGVTSGASVPEVLVQEVLADLADAGYRDVETVVTAEEDLMFSLPKELRHDAEGNPDDRALGGRTEAARLAGLNRRRSLLQPRDDAGRDAEAPRDAVVDERGDDAARQRRPEAASSAAADAGSGRRDRQVEHDVEIATRMPACAVQAGSVDSWMPCMAAACSSTRLEVQAAVDAERHPEEADTAAGHRERTVPGARAGRLDDGRRLSGGGGGRRGQIRLRSVRPSRAARTRRTAAWAAGRVPPAGCSRRSLS